MEEQANKKRQAAEVFKVGDKVWLNLRNIQTPQLSKKLSWVNGKYQVTRVIDSHSVELNVPTSIWPRFNVDLLKRAAEDPLPSQQVSDEQPLPVLPPETDDDQGEYVIDEVLRAEKRPRGRGHRREVFVKWKGYEQPNWEPRSNLEDTEALEKFEMAFGTGDGVGKDAGAIMGPRKVTKRSMLKTLSVRLASCYNLQLLEKIFLH